MIIYNELKKSGYKDLESLSCQCKICKEEATLFDVVDFNKAILDSFYLKDMLTGVPVHYYQCSNCKLIFSKNFDNFCSNDWIKFIYNEDYFKLLDTDYKYIRPMYHARLIMSMIGKNKKDFKCLDYGGGNGALTNLLNENGYNFVSYDPYDVQDIDVNSSEKFNLISCFEVLEHAADPLATLIELFQFGTEDSIYIASTQLSDNFCDHEKRCGWSYVAPRNGHVTIFSQKTMNFISEKFGLNYFKIGNGLHLFSKSNHLLSYRNKAVFFKVLERLNLRK
tara:strand:+ start:302 stop:1138 length:837 start_codon:yes stop_codon:yes gene_type:complete